MYYVVNAVLRTERIPVNSERLFVPCEKRHFSAFVTSVPSLSRHILRFPEEKRHAKKENGCLFFHTDDIQRCI